MSDDGALAFKGTRTGAVHVELRSDVDVIVVMANTPHPLDPRSDYAGSVVRVIAWRADPPADPIETATTPERRRAYENNALYSSEWL